MKEAEVNIEEDEVNIEEDEDSDIDKDNWIVGGKKVEIMKLLVVEFKVDNNVISNDGQTLSYYLVRD